MQTRHEYTFYIRPKLNPFYIRSKLNPNPYSNTLCTHIRTFITTNSFCNFHSLFHQVEKMFIVYIYLLSEFTQNIK